MRNCLYYWYCSISRWACRGDVAVKWDNIIMNIFIHDNLFDGGLFFLSFCLWSGRIQNYIAEKYISIIVIQLKRYQDIAFTPYGRPLLGALLCATTRLWSLVSPLGTPKEAASKMLTVGTDAWLLLDRVRTGGETSDFRLSVPVVVVVGLGELEPRDVDRLHGTRVPCAAVLGPSATAGPHPAPTAFPCAPNCPAAQQHQRGHG